MKLTRRIKKRALPSIDRNGFTKVSRCYLPAGYYLNRPKILNPYRQWEIGRFEGVRFISSPTI